MIIRLFELAKNNVLYIENIMEGLKLVGTFLNLIGQGLETLITRPIVEKFLSWYKPSMS